MSWFKKSATPKPVYRWVGTRPCSCGSPRFCTTSIDDLIQCSGCGLLYSVSSSVKNPIAKLVEVEHSTDSPTA